MDPVGKATGFLGLSLALIPRQLHLSYILDDNYAVPYFDSRTQEKPSFCLAVTIFYLLEQVRLCA
jgi:hypothetical protein